MQLNSFETLVNISSCNYQFSLNVCIKNTHLNDRIVLIKADEEFMKMVDELVGLAETDEELCVGIKWIDNESKKLEISFYDMFLIVIQRHLADEKAKEWLKERHS